MTDQDLGGELAQSAPAAIPSNFSYLQSLIQQLPAPLAPDIKAAASGQSSLADQAQSASQALAQGLVGANIGTESGASIGGYQGELFYGNANVLTNPLIDSIGNFDAWSASETQWAGDWYGKWGIISGDNPVASSGILYVRDDPDDNPFNSAIVEHDMTALAGDHVHCYFFHYPLYWVPNIDPGLAYLVASAKVTLHGATIDSHTTTFRVRAEIVQAGFAGTSSPYATGPWLDLTSVDPSQTYRISAAFPRPSAGWWSDSYQMVIRTEWECDNSAGGTNVGDVLYFGEPSFALAASQSPPPFAPIIAKWVPAMVKVDDQTGEPMFQIGDESRATSDAHAQILWGAGGGAGFDLKMYRDASGTLAINASSPKLVFAAWNSDLYESIQFRRSDGANRGLIDIGTGSTEDMRFGLYTGAAGSETYDERVRLPSTGGVQLEVPDGDYTNIAGMVAIPFEYSGTIPGSGTLDLNWISSAIAKVQMRSPFAMEVVGISVSLASARTAGSLVAQAYNASAGASKGPQATIDGATTNDAYASEALTGAQDVAVSNLLRFRLTTSGFTPTANSVKGVLWVVIPGIA